MAHVLVVEDNRVFMDEEVRPVHLDDEHSSVQLLERLAWALHDADKPPRNRSRPKTVRRRPQRYTAVPRS